MTSKLGNHDGPVIAELLAQSSCGVVVTDPDGGYIRVNERWCEITGTSADAAIGNGWMDAVHPDDRAVVVGAWWSSVQTAPVFDEQFRFLCTKGSTPRAHAIVRPVVDADEIVAWVGSVCEEPDPVLPSRTTHDERSLLAAALVNSSDLVVVIDESATLTYVSAASRRILGWEPTEWVGRNVLEDPAVRGILVNARDISERRAFQRGERHAQRRFEQAFERSPIGMALTTLDGGFVRVNDAICTLLDRSAADPLSTAVLEITHPGDLRLTVDAAVELLEGSSSSSPPTPTATVRSQRWLTAWFD